MVNRDWLENIFLDSIKKVKPDFEETDENTEIISKTVHEIMPRLIEIVDNHLKKKSKKILKLHQKEISTFKKNLAKTWESAFNELELFISFNLEYGIILSESYRKKKNDDVKFETLVRLHARACQIASEVLTLIKNGFADGALARWRSLYEISILASFLENKPVDLCQRYLDYYFVENYYETLEYQKNCEKLGYEPLNDDEIKEATNSFNLQKDKYGDDFARLYGWIGDYLPKKKWNFAGIEEMVEFKFMRSFYKMANNFIHSGARGFLYKLGTYNQDEVMLAGPSNYGFADPAQNTAYSLLQTTMTLSGFDTYLEDVFYVQIGLNMLDRLTEKFIHIQKKIEEEAEELNKYYTQSSKRPRQ
jgi:hypothetical protein